MDHITAERRSWLMSRVHPKDTTPELVVRRELHAAGFRFRLHRKDLPGKPDVVLVSRKVAIFVHGCFWHRHAGCSKASVPKSNIEFWRAKFERNVKRDLDQERLLRDRGWRVLTIWECQTKTRGNALASLLALLEQDEERRAS